MFPRHPNCGRIVRDGVRGSRGESVGDEGLVAVIYIQTKVLFAILLQ